MTTQIPKFRDDVPFKDFIREFNRWSSDVTRGVNDFSQADLTHVKPWAAGFVRFGDGRDPVVTNYGPVSVKAGYFGPSNVVVTFTTNHPKGDIFEMYTALAMPTTADFNLLGKHFAVTRTGFWYNVINLGGVYQNVTTLPGGCFSFRVYTY